MTKMERRRYKYYVIQFSNVPYKHIDDYVCIPGSWVKKWSTEEKVIVAYPFENTSDTEKRVKKRERFSKNWFSYMAVVKYGTDVYEDAQIFIKEKINILRYESKCSSVNNAHYKNKSLNVNNGEKCKKKTSRFKPDAESMAEIDIPGEFVVSSKNEDKYANKIRLKRISQPCSSIEAEQKWSKVIKPSKAVSQVAEDWFQASQCLNENQLSPAHEDFPTQNSYTQQIHVKKSNEGNSIEEIASFNGTKNRPSVMKNSSNLPNSSFDPKITHEQVCLNEIETRFMEHRAKVYAMVNDMSKEFINLFELTKKILKERDDLRALSTNNNTLTASSAENTTAEVTNVSIRIQNEETQQIDDDDDDDFETVPKKKRQTNNKLRRNSCLQRNQFVLPPEYDENDSRWTLKHRQPAPELVELMPHSGVYINNIELTNCKRLSTNCKKFARMLLGEIFTTSALTTCSLTGARAKAFYLNGSFVRPGLDEQARTVILNYVKKYGFEQDWDDAVDTDDILNNMRNKLRDMRLKYG